MFVCEFRENEDGCEKPRNDPARPHHQELVRRRSSFGWTLSLIMLVSPRLHPLVAKAPKFLGMRPGTGVTTIGIPIGLFVIVSAFVLTGIYVSKANSNTTP
jgi:uncharacterized membrane protein (DUF485 family)